MKWLPAIFKRKNEIQVQVESRALEIQEESNKALRQIGESLAILSQFVSAGGLVELVRSASLASGANALLGGLAVKNGRESLDARTLKQNAIEIAEQVLLIHDKFKERLSAEAKGKTRDPDIHDPDKEFEKWKEQWQKDHK
jgi:hypothetical protein